MAKAADYPVKPVMLVAGDDAGRKPVVMELIGKLGFEPVDAGPLKNARLLEHGLDRSSNEARARAGLRFRTGEHQMMPVRSVVPRQDLSDCQEVNCRRKCASIGGLNRAALFFVDCAEC